jgi:hypothetical protein
MTKRSFSSLSWAEHSDLQVCLARRRGTLVRSA